MSHYFYDDNQVRYELVKTIGSKPLNWLFVPGGPGADSSYLKTLINELDISGNIWLIDLPGNGDNVNSLPADYNYNQWLDLIVPTIARFENPVCVGHSCGSMFPLIYPELEDYLIGFVAINPSPSAYLQESAIMAKEHGLPDLSQELAAFGQNPNEESFMKVLYSFLPYHFPEHSREKGQKIFHGLPFRFEPMAWWNEKMFTMPYVAQWVPENVPMLAIGGEKDFITPIRLFENDKRFERPNIKFVKFSDAGHFPWVEQPETIGKLIKEFNDNLVLKK